MKLALNHILKSKYLYITIIGFIITLLLHLIAPLQKGQGTLLAGLLITIGISYLVWEGSFKIDKLMNASFPWDKKPVRRVLLQIIISISYSVIVIYFGTFAYDHFVCKLPEPHQQLMINAGIVIGSLFTLIIMSFEVGRQFFHNWKSSLLEVERYKKESTEAQLENLKNQVNPHFLFNNLSVLSSLVYKDQDKAVDFINQFSKVYRYILDNKNKELVDLETEQKFIASYCYLLKIRFSDAINFDFKIDDDKKLLLMPPMALQLLIENTIKHNETSIEMPLHVSVVAKNDYLIVTNNLQLRTTNEEGSKIGLKNIQSRYAHFTDKEVKIIKTDKVFEVQIPLLKGT